MSKSPQSPVPSSNQNRTMTALSTNIARALSSSDEFRHGFPSGGLSAASNKWWGTGESIADMAENGGHGTAAELLTAARKKAAEEGRRGRVKLGVSESDRALLRRVFGSSWPPHWLDR